MQKNFWGRTPRPPFLTQLRQIKYYEHNASHYTAFINKKKCIIPWYSRTYVHIALYYAYTFVTFFFAFHFLGKKLCPPPHFSSLSYAVDEGTPEIARHCIATLQNVRIGECPSIAPFLENNGPRPRKGPRSIVFKEWNDTRTFAYIKSTHRLQPLPQYM